MTSNRVVVPALLLVAFAVQAPASAQGPGATHQPGAASADAWMNCFAVVAGKGCTTDGSVIVAHNEDSGTDTPVHHWKVPAEVHADGKVRELLEGGEVPYAPRTPAYIWCQMPGQKYSDTFFNEHGVAVVTNACKSREDRPQLTDGGITLLLRRIVGVRATSARHGVEIAIELLAKYGYGDSGRCMTIADADEAWILDMVRGKHWAAARVPDDKCAVIANHFSIHHVDPDDRDNFLLSPGLIEYAVERGWYDEARDGPFDFATVYGGDRARRHRSNVRRAWRAHNLIGSEPVAEDWLQPTFVAPRRKVSVQDLMGVLRDHYEGTDYDKSLGYQLGSPNHNGATICAGHTSFSTVFQLRSDMPAAVGAVMWIAMGRPDASIYVPWYAGVTAVPEGYATGDWREAERRHMDPAFVAKGSPAAFAAVNDYQRSLDQDYGSHYQQMDAARDALEAEWFAEQAAFERQVVERFGEDPAAARAMLTGRSARLQARARACMAGWAAALSRPADARR
ncbi:MAG: C69 family dipeptidase [Planctomycetes bacterium]|nr:C69 family dipeptidase [Planctomycetota bacterium]